MSSTDVSAQSSTTAVTLIQAEQAVGEAESLTSTGDAGPQVQAHLLTGQPSLSVLLRLCCQHLIQTFSSRMPLPFSP